MLSEIIHFSENGLIYLEKIQEMSFDHKARHSDLPFECLSVKLKFDQSWDPFKASRIPIINFLFNFGGEFVYHWYQGFSKAINK